MNQRSESIRLAINSLDQYATRLAHSDTDIRAAQSLRFQVFNLELNEGLAQSYTTGLDVDTFDTVCDHLLVEHLPTQQIVGTYRLQLGANAAQNLGYYCAQEFQFEVFEPLRGQIVELGRACVHRQHRNLIVLGMLWRGIADYAKARNGRYLIGCSSLTSQDPAEGAAAYTDLCRHKHLIDLPWRTSPTRDFECPLDRLTEEAVPIPKLLRAYLAIGAKICGAPAIDRQFKTIDFLTMLDLQAMPAAARERFFG